MHGLWGMGQMMFTKYLVVVGDDMLAYGVSESAGCRRLLRETDPGIFPNSMTTKDAIQFVKDRGVVLESGRGPVPNLAETIAGVPIRGSWWGHAKGGEIWKTTRALRKAREILVCRLVDGKVSYVHRRLWPALVKLARRIHPDRLAAIHEVHLPSGRHEVRTTPFPDWVPREVMDEAGNLEDFEASAQLGEWLPNGLK